MMARRLFLAAAAVTLLASGGCDRQAERTDEVTPHATDTPPGAVGEVADPAAPVADPAAPVADPAAPVADPAAPVAQPGPVYDPSDPCLVGTEVDVAGAKLPEADPVSTATQAPVAEDLERYVEGVAGQGPLCATIATSEGTVHCRLFEERAPRTVANFVGLTRGLKAFVDPNDNQPRAGERFYDGTRLHRVIPNFMIQMGDRAGTGAGTPGYRFGDEFDQELRHDRGGLLSMANAGPGTNGSQFFITEVATPWLDDRHTIFGHCKELDVIKKITGVPKKPSMDPRNPPSEPLEPVILESITVARGGPAPAGAPATDGQ